MNDFIKCNLADNMYEVKANNIAFLEGKLKSCYSAIGLHDESNPILDKLLNINRLGLITTNSQPGVFDTEEDYYQRCYISGIIKKTDFINLKKIMRILDPEIKILNTSKSVKQLQSYYEDDTNTVQPPEWHIISKDSNEIFTHTIYGEKWYSCDDFAKCIAYNDIKDKYITVELVDLKWGRVEHLLDCLIYALKYMNEHQY
jgi:hypothetical protein